MKVAQLVQGKTYQNKRGERRHLRQITGPRQSYLPNTAFFLEERTRCVDHLPLRQFAEWAWQEAEPIKSI